MRALLAVWILASSSALAGEPWSTSDQVLATLMIGATVIDWGQTRYISKAETVSSLTVTVNNGPPVTSTFRERTYHESNKVLGRDPSTDRVDLYFAAAIAGTLLAADLMPARWRGPFLAGVAAWELRAAYRNYELGLRVAF